MTFLTSANEQHIGAIGNDETLIVDFTKTDPAPHFRDMLSLIDGGSTGTVGSGCAPEISGFLEPGDVVELEVTGLGVLRNRIIAPGAN